MSKLHHVVTDLHQVYLTEMEAKIKPQMGKKEAPSSKSGSSEGGGGGEDNIKKQARQLAYDTRYKARREDIPLERAWSQVLQNSSASAPVKELAKNMIFGGVKKEEFELEEGKKDLKKGEVLLAENLTLKKPQGPLRWEDRFKLIGKKTTRKIDANEHLNLSDLE